MRKVLITGAGTGIGAATAALFHEKGCHVVLVGRRRETLNAAAQNLKNSTIEICDLQDPKQIEALVKKTGSIDILVNNAGIIERGNLADQPIMSWRKQYETNVFGPVLLTQMFLKNMISAKKGSIINVASSLGVRPVAGTSAYSSSKAAMISWTQALALEVAPYGIRVNCVAPGIVDTPILTGHQGSLSGEDKVKLGKLHPLGRLGRPEDIAQAIYYLSTTEWTTGATLTVDGGISLTQN